MKKSHCIIFQVEGIDQADTIYLFKPHSIFAPDLDESEPSRGFWILENIKEQAFLLTRGLCPDRSMCLFELFNIFGSYLDCDK